MNNKGIYLFIVNDEKKIFTVWLVKSDIEINHKIIERQEVGEKIRCFASKSTGMNIYDEIKEYEQQMNYKYTIDAIIY